MDSGRPELELRPASSATNGSHSDEETALLEPGAVSSENGHTEPFLNVSWVCRGATQGLGGVQHLD